MTMRREPVGIYPPSAAAAVLGLVLDVKRDFGASGSSESTTGSITAGSSVLTLASPIDFQNGQGISVANAGPLPTISAPTSATATAEGTTGTTTIQYAVAALDGKGGVTAALSFSLTNANATLSTTNYVALSVTAVTGAAGYAWWRVSTNGTSPTTTGFIGVTDATTTTLNDTGINAVTPPIGIPAVPNASAIGDILVTIIKSGGGTTTLTLQAPAQSTANNTTVCHDDSIAMQGAINAAGESNNSGSGNILHIPAGVYLCSQTLTVSKGTSITIIGDGKLESIIAYAGNTPQPFLVFVGENHGSYVTNVSLVGYPADPVVQLLSSNGSGTNGYQSLVTFDNVWIGYYYPPGGSAPSNYLAYSGIDVQCDVFRMINSDIWGRNYGLRLNQGTTDAYITNCGFSVLPQASEPNQIAVWCNNSGSLDFTGTANFAQCTFEGAGASTIAFLGRSVISLTNCYCESSNLPVSLDTCIAKIVGGSWTAANTANYLFYANGSSGEISPANVSVGGLANLKAIVFTINSPSTWAWRIILPNSAEISGSLPSNPLQVDQPWYISFPPIFAGSFTPPASPLVSGSVYQNRYGVPITIYQPAYATTSGTAGTVAVALGPTSTPPTIFTKQIPGTTSSTAPDMVEVRVPPGWYYSMTATSATLATAVFIGE